MMLGGDGPPRVLVYVVDAGGGHRAAAEALTAAAELCRTPLDLQVVSLQDVLDPLDPVKRLSGLSIQNGYNALLRTHRTAHLRPLLRLLHAGIRVRWRALVTRVARDIEDRRPRAVVSLVPNFNGVIRDAISAASPGLPFLVVLTDLADMPPRFWIEPGVGCVAVATDEAARQAARLGVPPASVVRTSGMVLHPRFYPRRLPAERASLRQELGLRPEGALALVMFGGKGSDEMRGLSAALLAAHSSWQVAPICGDNPELFARLGPLEERSGGRLRRIGFTRRVADYLAVSDVLVTKPGPGALSEAFHARVPVVVTLDRRTIPQERFNARLVEALGLGLVTGAGRDMARAAARLVADEALRARTLAALERLPENRAVFEVLDLVRSLAGDGGRRGAPARGPALRTEAAGL